MVREGLTKKETSELRAKGSRSQGKAFQAEGTAHAKLYGENMLWSRNSKAKERSGNGKNGRRLGWEGISMWGWERPDGLGPCQPV